MTIDSKDAALRPLTGTAVGISISVAEEAILRSRGLKPDDINQITVELCHRLVSLGAQVVLGHQWRPGGVMEAVVKFAQVYQAESDAPIIHNFLAYPDRAALSIPERERLGRVVAIHDDESRQPLPRKEAIRRMRQEMAAKSDARICLCGKLSQPEGFTPGIIEEVVLTLAGGKPAYISSMMGGNAELLARFLAGDADIFWTMPPPYDRLPVVWRESREFQAQLAQLAEFDVPRLAERCGLSVHELGELFNAQNLDTVLHLTAKGLSNGPRSMGHR